MQLNGCLLRIVPQVEERPIELKPPLRGRVVPGLRGVLLCALVFGSRKHASPQPKCPRIQRAFADSLGL